MLVKKSRIPVKEIVFVGFLPSFLKRLIYRLRGYKIGKRVSFGFGSVVLGDEVAIGDGTSIGMLSIVRGRDVSIGRYVKIGATTVIDTERIEILEDAKINEQVFIGGLSSPESHIRIGRRAIVMQMSFLNPARPLIIGDDVGIGGHCIIFTHGSWQSALDGYPVTFAPVTIGNNVWLPWRVFVMPGVTIGDGATIGANSLVNKDIPPGVLAAGSPAKVLRTADEYPNRPTSGARDRMVRGFLGELQQHLEYHHFDVERTEDVAGLQLRISERGGREHRLLYVGAGDQVPHPDSPHCVVLSLRRIADVDRATISDAGGMWLDIESLDRCGSNAVGEEVAAFLSRFGIRFRRCD